MRNAVVLASCLCMMVTAQLLWKAGLTRIGLFDVTDASLISRVGDVLTSWRMLLGIALFGICTLLWFDLLSRLQLSFLYPFMSLSYVLAFFAGWAWLDERPSVPRLIGIVVICIGIALVSKTGD